MLPGVEDESEEEEEEKEEERLFKPNAVNERRWKMWSVPSVYTYVK